VYDTCGPDCLDNALAGPLAFGEAFPTGHTHPPAFEGCRCLLVAVVADERGPDDPDQPSGGAVETDEADASDAG
jgi:hypothetical protein